MFVGCAGLKETAVSDVIDQLTSWPPNNLYKVRRVMNIAYVEEKCAPCAI